MKNDKTGRRSFGLREIGGQRRWVHLECERKFSKHEDQETYLLTFFAYNPLFKVSTAEAAARVLQKCPDWFRTSPQEPTWGGIDPATLEVVQINETPAATATPAARPVVFEHIASRKYVAHRQCEELLQKSLTPHYSWTVHIVPFPLGECLETLKQKCEGATIHMGCRQMRASMYCQSVLPAGPGQATLITTSMNLQERHS
jgi:hypothetical protein